MTYAFSWHLQRAVFAALSADPALREVAGGRVYDEPPHGAELGPGTGPYVLIGEERVEPWSTAPDRGAIHELRATVVAAPGGFGAAKQAAAAVSDRLLGALPLARGRVVNSGFLGGRALRAGDGRRRIELRFRIVVEDDPSTP
jgi:hypothetical protein